MTDAAADDLTAPIEGTGLRLVLVPAAVLLAASEAEGPVDWPGVGTISEELAVAMPAAMRIRQAEADPSVAAWLIRGIVVDDAASPTGLRVVGHLGGHDRPDGDGMVEVGYTVAAADRGRGLATEGARTWFAWAHRHGATTARLSIVPTNAPSIAIAARLGLKPTERVWDDDDQVWEQVFEAALPLDHAP
ncbi:GNAT family N-acetyltransferase [Aquihabitans sp. G128]|uniref:GNAT family N-acetyltransferase n=1 Tax=Aquihabitans sp. G128 TaxID=2849779 RepID=UPI001C23382D|nr:GNAT family N-acetyltransferase [Aquihabitans sp. G128]QXC59788.1 GNAT family N-acetyltransferase [Aquihabitans sp. G128]